MYLYFLAYFFPGIFKISNLKAISLFIDIIFSYWLIPYIH